MNFTQLNLSKPTLDVLQKLGFETPTEIQEMAIPLLLEGENDFIGLAQTGTGKTLAFGIPIIERIDKEFPKTQALILAPTRELGQQIAEQISLFTENNKGLNVLAVYGGANINTQLKALQKPQHIIIATPGRLLDLIKRRAVNLSNLEFLVLDEADEMLNMGFKEDIDKILATSSPDKLTWLFSATMGKDIRKIVKKYMNAPLEIQLNPSNESNVNIRHFSASLHPKNKVEAIARIIDTQKEMRGVVFCRTKRETQEVSDALAQRGYRVDALHGDLSQSQRDSVMKLFKKHKLDALIATDIAARGIDVKDITHVIHHNLPDDVESYTHRSGRTARAGKEGESIALVSNRDVSKLQNITKELQITFNEYLIPTSEELLGSKVQRWIDQILENDATHDKEVDHVYNSIKTQFQHLSKDQILKNLLQQELLHFKNPTEDLNEKLDKPSHSGRGRSRGKFKKDKFKSTSGNSEPGRKRSQKNKNNRNSRGGYRGK